MWTYGIQNPIMMKSRLGIQSDMKRAYLSEAVCREVVQQGCLHEAMWQGWFGGWDFWFKLCGVLFTQGQQVTSSVLYIVSSIIPLYYLIRNTRSMIDVRAMVSEGQLAAQKALTGTSRKKKASPRTLPDNFSAARPRTGSAPRSLSDAGASRVHFSHPSSARLSTCAPSSSCSWHQEFCVALTRDTSDKQKRGTYPGADSEGLLRRQLSTASASSDPERPVCSLLAISAPLLA